MVTKLKDNISYIKYIREKMKIDFHVKKQGMGIQELHFHSLSVHNLISFLRHYYCSKGKIENSMPFYT
jgi:hypothetical protein